jgi:hypothetical protein
VGHGLIRSFAELLRSRVVRLASPTQRPSGSHETRWPPRPVSCDASSPTCLHPAAVRETYWGSRRSHISQSYRHKAGRRNKLGHCIITNSVTRTGNPPYSISPYSLSVGPPRSLKFVLWTAPRQRRCLGERGSQRLAPYCLLRRAQSWRPQLGDTPRVTDVNG